jgi:IS30 family transposase
MLFLLMVLKGFPFDQGKEFSGHKPMALECDSYFAIPIMDGSGD